MRRWGTGGRLPQPPCRPTRPIMPPRGWGTCPKPMKAVWPFCVSRVALDRHPEHRPDKTGQDGDDEWAFPPEGFDSRRTIAGASIAPTLAPALKSLVASARSRLGNHVAPALTAAAQFPPSPKSERPALRKKLLRLCTSECAMAAIFQKTMETA